MRYFLLILLASLSISADYLSQGTIDKMVQDAYYQFVSASAKSGGSGQKRAIERAQATATKLKNIAEDDPNRRYILSKVAELESQISLEKEEISLKWEYARVASINKLVPIFNEVLAKRGPSFGQLYSLYNRMVAIDIAKSNELAEKINQKSHAVSQDIRNQVHASFRANKYSTIEKTYSYAVKNRKYLEISDQEFRGWGRKIDAKRSADFLTKMFNTQVAEIETMVKESKLDEAHRHILVLALESSNASAQLSSNTSKSIEAQLARLNQTITSEERRMVIYSKSLVSRGEIDQAQTYLEQVMIPAGVSLESRAEVTRAIQGKTEAPSLESKEVNSSIGAITTSSVTISTDAMMSDMTKRTKELKKEFDQLAIETKKLYNKIHKAEIKQREKDLIALTKNQVKADAVLLKIQDLFSAKKGNKAVKLFIKKHKYLYAESSPQLYVDTKKQVNEARRVNSANDSEIQKLQKELNAQAPEEKEEEALKATVEIYNSVEKNQIDQAYGLFLAHEMLLEEHSYKEAFITLKRTVVKAYAKEQNL